MKLISIYSAAGQLEAEIVKAFLESQEIQVVLNQESIGRTIGLSAGRLGRVDVMVNESQEAEAKALLADVEAGKFSIYNNENHNRENHPPDANH